MIYTDNYIVYLGEKAQEVTGYVGGELISEDITEFLVSEHKKSIINDIKDLSSSEEIKKSVYRDDKK